MLSATGPGTMQNYFILRKYLNQSTDAGLPRKMVSVAIGKTWIKGGWRLITGWSDSGAKQKICTTLWEMCLNVSCPDDIFIFLICKASDTLMLLIG